MLFMKIGNSLSTVPIKADTKGFVDRICDVLSLVARLRYGLEDFRRISENTTGKNKLELTHFAVYCEIKIRHIGARQFLPCPYPPKNCTIYDQLHASINRHKTNTNEIFC